jgi:hypothetical protein
MRSPRSSDESGFVKHGPIDAPPRRRAWFVPMLILTGLAGALSGLPGCNRDGGLSHSDRVALERANAATSLGALGVSAEQKKYPQGVAWVVDLSGKEMSDKIVKLILSLGQVTELRLGGSKITDKQLAALSASSSLGLLLKLDISDTPVTDAGLEAVTPLLWLTELNVKGSQVTPSGLANFQKNRLRHPMGMKLKIER